MSSMYMVAVAAIGEAGCTAWWRLCAGTSSPPQKWSHAGPHYELVPAADLGFVEEVVILSNTHEAVCV